GTLMRRYKALIAICLGTAFIGFYFFKLNLSKTEVDPASQLRATAKLSLPISARFYYGSILPYERFELTAVISVTEPVSHSQVSWIVGNNIELIESNHGSVPTELEPGFEYTVRAMFFHNSNDDERISLSISSGAPENKSQIDFQF